MIWIVFLIIALVACWWMFRAAPADVKGEGQAALIFKSQLDELAREEAQGLISADDAKRARSEIERRLAVVLRDGGAVARSGTDMRRVLTGGSLLMLGLAAALYLNIGRPDLSPSPVVAASQGVLPEVETMIAGLEARLAKTPDDVDGWRMLGWANFKVQRYEKSVAAFEKAVALEPTAETLGLLGESLTIVAKGKETPRARNVFEEALKLNAKEQLPQFYLATFDEASGNSASALVRFRALAANGGMSDSNKSLVKKHLLELGSKTGTDVAQDLKLLDGSAAVTGDSESARIDGMIAGLAQKLADNPENLEGWKMLIRSLSVRKGEDAAREALMEAQKVFAGRKELEDLRVFAGEIGVD